MAAGKSTVAELLARRLPTSVHVRGDVFRKMVVNGRVDMSPDAGPEAMDQLHLRYALAGHTADAYADAGFDAIVQDVIIGAGAGRVRRPDPDARAVSGRPVAHRRAPWSGASGSGPRRATLHFSPGVLDEVLRRETAQIGYWLDSSAQTPDETVDDILANLERARV